MTNWLARRSAGAFTGLQATPFVKTVTAISADPQKADTHVVDDNTREYYQGQPSGFVKKIRGAGPVKGALKLRVTGKRDFGEGTFIRPTADFKDVLVATAIGGGLDGGAMIYQSDIWTAGDDKAYKKITINGNLFMGQDGNGNDYWTSWTTEFERDPATGSYEATVTFGPQTVYSPLTSGDPWLENPTDDYTFYATFENLMTYADSALTDQTGFGFDYGAHYLYFTPRITADSAHGLSDYAMMETVFGDKALIYPGTSYSNYTYYTFTPESTWIPAGDTVQQKVRCRFVYQTPTSCEDCWYEGATVEVKVRYKKAALTRVSATDPSTGLDGYKTTLGSWSSHSDVTKTLTLPASGVGNQLLGSDFDVPEQAGYAVAIDDIEIISITS